MNLLRDIFTGHAVGMNNAFVSVQQELKKIRGNFWEIKDPLLNIFQKNSESFTKNEATEVRKI